MDGESREVILELRDGTVVRVPARVDLVQRGIGMKRFVYDVDRRELEIRLPDGCDVVSEVGDGRGAGDAAVRGGRPVVYLDQCHWITLARQLWAPQKVPSAIRAAARELIELARAKRIILPLSAGHFTETAPTDRQWRRDMAATMLGLSRGWLMRNPVRVRRLEIEASLAGEEPVAEEVFGLKPHELFAEDLRLMEAPRGAPPELGDVFPLLTAITAIYETMTADEKLGSREALAMAETWATNQQKLADRLRSQQAGRQRVRLVARGQLLADLAREIASAAGSVGVDPRTLKTWLSTDDEVARMPYLGRLEALIYHRLRDSNDRWHAHDFNDMHYLSCAAGYADLVVAEKKMTHLLCRAERSLSPRARVFPSLPQVIRQLEQWG